MTRTKSHKTQIPRSWSIIKLLIINVHKSNQTNQLQSIKISSCGTKPMASRKVAKPMSLVSTPLSITRPPRGSKTRKRTNKKLLFPHPVVPTTPTCQKRCQVQKEVELQIVTCLPNTDYWLKATKTQQPNLKLYDIDDYHSPLVLLSWITEQLPLCGAQT